MSWCFAWDVRRVEKLAAQLRATLAAAKDGAMMTDEPRAAEVAAAIRALLAAPEGRARLTRALDEARAAVAALGEARKPTRQQWLDWQLTPLGPPPYRKEEPTMEQMPQIRRSEDPMAEMRPATAGLAVGRTVHYVLPDGRNQLQHRPAVVVRTWPASPNDPADPAVTARVNLLVFMDGANDGYPLGSEVQWRTDVGYDATGATPGSWHWPEHVA